MDEPTIEAAMQRASFSHPTHQDRPILDMDKATAVARKAVAVAVDAERAQTDALIARMAHVIQHGGPINWPKFASASEVTRFAEAMARVAASTTPTDPECGCNECLFVRTRMASPSDPERAT